MGPTKSPPLLDLLCPLRNYSTLILLQSGVLLTIWSLYIHICFQIAQQSLRRCLNIHSTFLCFSTALYLFFRWRGVNVPSRTIGNVFTVPRVWDTHPLNLPLFFWTSCTHSETIVPWFYFQVESTWSFGPLISIFASGLCNKIWEVVQTFILLLLSKSNF